MIPLEDEFQDLLSKAAKGQGWSDAQVAEEAGLTPTQVAAVRSGRFDEMVVRAMADVLGLDGDALCVLARGGWHPGAIEVFGLSQFVSPYMAMTVNAYLVRDPGSPAAAVFDTGADAGDLLDCLAVNRLEVGGVFLTHGHGDHIADLERVRAETSNAPVYAGVEEGVDGTLPVGHGESIRVGGLEIEVMETAGHSAGGRSYRVRGLMRPVVIVGDALFAGSMGGAPSAWEQARRQVAERILSLDGSTVICPGHGPMTTVGQELEHNPFFAREAARP